MATSIQRYPSARIGLASRSSFSSTNGPRRPASWSQPPSSDWKRSRRIYFRGFYCRSSEVGSKTLGIASSYLPAVCMNRNLWGVEGFEEISIRHSKFAAQRFAHEAAPALDELRLVARALRRGHKDCA